MFILILERNDYMEKIPNIISTKDLSYIEDMFNWHFVICKKAYYYSDLVCDETISNHLIEVAKKHEKILEKLVNMLGGEE
jgi:hypothetical protein